MEISSSDIEWKGPGPDDFWSLGGKNDVDLFKTAADATMASRVEAIAVVTEDGTWEFRRITPPEPEPTFAIELTREQAERLYALSYRYEAGSYIKDAPAGRLYGVDRLHEIIEDVVPDVANPARQRIVG